MNKDFKFIKEKFEKENITAPESLNENFIFDMLDNKKQKKIKFYNKPLFKGLVSAAACLIVVLSVIGAVVNNSRVNIKPFKSYEQLNSTVKFHYMADNVLTKIRQYIDNLMHKAEDEVYTAEATSDKAVNFGVTNQQVKGVSEGDIIKNDGKYIYYSTRIPNSNKVFIYENGKKITTISPFETHVLNEGIEEIYVKGTTLVVNTSLDYKLGVWIYERRAKTYIYDLTDIKKPKLLKTFTQSGEYVSSRMIDDNLYIVSQKMLKFYECTDGFKLYVTEDDNEREISADNIYRVNKNHEQSLLVTDTININTMKRSEKPKAIYGAQANVYCNENHLYLAVTNKTETDIVKFTLTPEEIKLESAARIDGYTNNQFSMDEKDGLLRIATTGKNGNNLFVLDENLKKIGYVGGFAKGEEVKAAKYIGDTAYIITYDIYERIDPLFVIDLKDPKKPIIRGSVEITGFSSNLLKVDENTFLGIGYSERDNNGIFVNGLKIALFDVSQPQNPIVLDSLTLGFHRSKAQQNHKAIAINEKDGYFAIDYTSNFNIGAMVIKVKDKKIELEKVIDVSLDYKKDNSANMRVTFVDNTIYLLDAYGHIYSKQYK